MKKSKKAFTLAEVLVTLGVIGVVAVLTVPNVMSNYQKKVMATQLKKAYNEISTAGALAVVTEEALTFKDTETFYSHDFLDKYFKKAKDCGKFSTDDIITNCFEKEYKNEDGEWIDFYGGDYFDDSSHCIVAKTGYIFCLNYESVNNSFLDINGSKKPNQIGKDSFIVGIGDDGSLSTNYDESLENIVNNNWEIE